MSEPEPLWKELQLTSAGRPHLLEEEVELRTCVDVALLKFRKEILTSCFCILTNLRLLLISSASSSALQCALADVDEASDCASMFHRSKRVSLTFASGDEFDLKFWNGGKDEMLSDISRALQRKAWEHVQKKVQIAPQEVAGFSARNAGVGGIVRRQERRRQDLSQLASEALTDLDALIDRAREAVGVIQRYAAYLVTDEAQKENTEGEASELEQLLQGVGITSPVTKLTAGKAYHEQLARQLADLLLSDNRLRRLGGMMTLTDVYMFYNRARGTELVSPTDLLCASEMLNTLRLGLSYTALPSGVKVIALDEMNSASICAKIAQQAAESPQGIHDVTVARALAISIILAKEYLLEAEQLLLVCRDESPEGISFYPNRFPEIIRALQG